MSWLVEMPWIPLDPSAGATLYETHGGPRDITGTQLEEGGVARVFLTPSWQVLASIQSVCCLAYRARKSAPSGRPPWDLWDRKLWMGFNGEKIIIFLTQSMPWIEHMLWNKMIIFHVKSLTVYCAIVQLKAVEKTQWERLHVSYVTSHSLRLAWTRPTISQWA